MVKLPAVELQTNDGEHEDGKEQEETDLEQGDHGLHDGLQHNLEAWRFYTETDTVFKNNTKDNVTIKVPKYMVSYIFL